VWLPAVSIPLFDYIRSVVILNQLSVVDTSYLTIHCHLSTAWYPLSVSAVVIYLSAIHCLISVIRYPLSIRRRYPHLAIHYPVIRRAIPGVSSQLLASCPHPGKRVQCHESETRGGE